jgi:UPF0755 protein
MGIIGRLLAWTIRIGIAVVVALAIFLAVFAFTTIKLPATPFEITLKHGSSLRSVARQIEASGLAVNSIAFEALARVLGKGRAVKAGDYELQASLSPLELLEKVTQGDSTQSEVTFIEGQTFAQMRKLLAENPGVRHDSQGMSEADLLKQIGADESSPEGLFFPNTYMFASGMSDLSILKRAYRTMQVNLNEAWARRSPDLPYGSAYEALIMASIVEKETAKAEERPRIAGVFIKRLQLGMKLQTDPTVVYGLGANYEGRLHRRDLTTDTPYNTYTRLGLPPTPIAMPGMAAIEAALKPDKTDALYFVAKGDGSHQFSKSLEEHNRAVNQYQR